jgi:hypothetical protein
MSLDQVRLFFLSSASILVPLESARFAGNDNRFLYQPLLLCCLRPQDIHEPLLKYGQCMVDYGSLIRNMVVR